MFSNLTNDKGHKEKTIAIILFHFYAVYEVQNADNATTFKVLPDDDHGEVNATAASSVSADKTITVTSIITNCRCPLCSADYSNKTTIQHCLLI